MTGVSQYTPQQRQFIFFHHKAGHKATVIAAAFNEKWKGGIKGRPLTVSGVKYVCGREQSDHPDLSVKLEPETSSAGLERHAKSQSPAVNAGERSSGNKSMGGGLRTQYFATQAQWDSPILAPQNPNTQSEPLTTNRQQSSSHPKPQPASHGSISAGYQTQHHNIEAGTFTIDWQRNPTQVKHQTTQYPTADSHQFQSLSSQTQAPTTTNWQQNTSNTNPLARSPISSSQDQHFRTTNVTTSPNNLNFQSTLPINQPPHQYPQQLQFQPPSFPQSTNNHPNTQFQPLPNLDVQSQGLDSGYKTNQYFTHQWEENNHLQTSIQWGHDAFLTDSTEMGPWEFDFTIDSGERVNDIYQGHDNTAPMTSIDPRLLQLSPTIPSGCEAAGVPPDVEVVTQRSPGERYRIEGGVVVID